MTTVTVLIMTIAIPLITIAGWIANSEAYRYLREDSKASIIIKTILLVASIIPWVTIIWLLVGSAVDNIRSLIKEFNRISSKEPETSRRHNR